MSKPTPERKMLHELKRKAHKKKLRMEALPDIIKYRREQKAKRTLRINYP